MSFSDEPETPPAAPPIPKATWVVLFIAIALVFVWFAMVRPKLLERSKAEQFGIGKPLAHHRVVGAIGQQRQGQKGTERDTF